MIAYKLKTKLRIDIRKKRRKKKKSIGDSCDLNNVLEPKLREVACD